MSFTFMESPAYFVTSESVTEGHPDKLCDQISDAILDATIAMDPQARVACETCTTTGLVVVMGEITTNAYVDIPTIIRETIHKVGYTKAEYGFDFATCGVMVSIKEQSKDIALGVDQSKEAKDKELSHNEEDYDQVGAGDQGMMVGFACNETPDFMPLPISLAHSLCQTLTRVRRDGTIPYLRPDGKSQVTVEYARGVPQRVDTVVIATQHDPDISHQVIQEDIIKHVILAAVPEKLLDNRTKYLVNATGRFVVGGPMGDAGLTGRKILVDTYGGVARHGGGAFSGKDPTKVDRSGAYAARYVAKNVVAAGLAERMEIQVAYSIGVAHPIAISIESFGTAKIGEDTIEQLINKHFDLRPSAIIDNLNLRQPIYQQTAAYGHFGRTDLDLPWERTDRANVLRKEAGL